MASGWRSKSMEASTSKAGEGQSVRNGGSLRKVASEGLVQFSQHFVSSDAFFVEIQEWLQYNLENLPSESSKFCSPFQLDELRLLDYAIEGVPCQLLFRMPPTASPSAEADRYLAVEDFVHAGAQRLWEIFWAATTELKSMPLSVKGPKASIMENINSGMEAAAIPGVALLKKDNRAQGGMPWEDIVTFVEIQENTTGALSQGDDTVPGLEIVGHALFHGFLMLSSRFLAERNQAVHQNIDIAYILCMDSQKGGVVRLKGDISKLETITEDVYVSAAEWFREHVEVAISPVDQVWNRFGNANWGDLGALQLLLALFYSIEQCQGPPKKDVAEMAAEYSAQLQQRRLERNSDEGREAGDTSSLHNHSHGKEVEIEEEVKISKHALVAHTMHLEPGTILWLEDAQWQQGFQIHKQLGSMQGSLYIGVSLNDMEKLLTLIVGAHPSQLEPCWEDMSTWYQVQRQTRVLNIMKQQGISSRFLPQIAGSGRVMHPGPCSKESPAGRCDHPWCGTPVLVTYPVGETLASAVEIEGWISADEALRCCHDCLSALRSTVSVGIQHGDINPEHMMRAAAADGEYYYVLTDWGHAVLEERDSPAISPKFSSTSALQEGRLCPASDAESLIYLLFFVCGGAIPEFDSMEAALHWRDRAWARRAIQQQLGEVSAVLKAFAEYVDSLCTTPYPVDYDIWLRRLNRALPHGDPRRMNDLSFGGSDFATESSGTSAPSIDN